MQDIFKRLKDEFSVKKLKGCIKVTVPLVIVTNGGLLNLKIKQNGEGYTIYCPTNIFLEANARGDQSYYFNIFERCDKNYHYDIKIKNGKFYKDYSCDRNIVVAIDEFIRFFVLLDNFFVNNNVVGHEEDFE